MNHDVEIMEEAKHCLKFGKLVDNFVARRLVGRIERQEAALKSLQDDVNHLNSLLRRTTGMGQGEIDAAAELEAEVEKLEEQSKIDSLVVGKCQAEILRLRRYEERMKWLHDCSTGCIDADGFEWGIYRVRWVNGQPAEVRQTLSDFSDLDAEMERTSLETDS